MNDSLIALYESADGKIKFEVTLKEDSVWLNRQQLVILFDRDIKTIGKHISNARKEELKDLSVVAKFATTDHRYQVRNPQIPQKSTEQG
jgi:hypothetical protein